MNVSRFVALTGALVAVSTASAQVIAIDTFGPGNAYNAGASHPTRGFDSPSGAFVSNGYLFTAEESGPVTQIVTAFEHITGANNYTFEIRLGDPNQVLGPIGRWENVEGGTAVDPVITISSPSVLGPAELTAGQSYWIIAIGNGSATGRWFERATPATSTYWASSSNNINWWLVNSTQLRAMRIILEGDPVCYANCDGSTVEPVLNVDDFTCFINEFAAAQSLSHEQQVVHYANCDGSTVAPALNVDDFTCFINEYAAGCR